MWVRFILFSISHILIIIYCSGFYFDLIGNLNSNYWSFFIIIFYVYNSKICFIYVIPFIFRFLVFIVTSSNPATVSLFFSQHNGVVSPSPLLIVTIWFFFGFLIAHECDHSFGSLLTSEILFWAIILFPYTPLRSLLL